MTHSRHAYTAVVSANEAFKLKYPRYLKGAVLAALALMALIVWLWPGYQPQPYQLRQKEEIFWVEVEAPPEVPDLPKIQDAPRLPPIIKPVPDEDAPPEVEPWRSIIDPYEPITAPRPPDYEGFVASSTLPRIQFQAKADYPEIARRSGLEGTVIVSARVNVSGRVDQVFVIQGAHPILERAAMDAAAKCRFSPAKQREMKVPAWVAIPYRFKLR